MSTFDEIWDLLSERGECDARGSAEYLRISALWNRAGNVVSLARFIIREANQNMSATEYNQRGHEAAKEYEMSQRDKLNLMKTRETEIVLTLRALVDALPANQAASLIYFAGTPLAVACKNAVELLAVVDAQKQPD